MWGLDFGAKDLRIQGSCRGGPQTLKSNDRFPKLKSQITSVYIEEQVAQKLFSGKNMIISHLTCKHVIYQINVSNIDPPKIIST